MSFVLFTQDLLNATSQTVEHGLGTTDLLITVWQRGAIINPSIRTVDENTIEVFAVTGGRVVIGAITTPKPKSRSTSAKRKPAAKGD